MDGRISNSLQVASVRRYTVTEGQEKGLDIIDCDNGKIRFLLNVSKACDVMQLYHEGQNVSFISKNGFTQRQAPFLKSFEGGMLYTCGIDSVGARDGYETHGTIHNIPAQIIRAECNENQIVIEAILRDTALFGKNLTVKRKITSEIGSGALTLVDTLINEGFREEEYCLLYHINIGYPMLDAGAKVVADVGKRIARTDWSKINDNDSYDIGEPVANMEETCYFLTLKSPEASLVNKKLGKQITVSYSGETLPHFVEWKSLASGDYALGFEPCTTELDDRFEYRKISPAEKIEFCVKIDVSDIKGA
ncbi:MAG: aldose 1-epimerase family protein [Clostridia bacterium]|nr:aldose 1-epimerase family protein [Clostridia bacterium]